MAEYIVDARPSDLFGIKMTGLLVRCKDCEYRNEWFCELDGHCHSPNFYCANGKRKDGDGE